MKEQVINDLVVENNWLPVFNFREAFSDLIKTGQLVNVAKKNAEPQYAITITSKEGLSNFYTEIPITIREEISANIKKNRINYRKKQEYIADYSKNADGTYTVSLKIENSAYTLLDLKIVVQTKQKAKWIYNNWSEKAATIYEGIYENLIDV